MIYKYGWKAYQAGELEVRLNELGAEGWRVVFLEWDNGMEKYLVLVEKAEPNNQQE